MTNDSRKGWKYKLETDRNQRLRRDPDVRRRVAAFKRESPKERAHCASRARTRHGGELEVHHVGGIKKRGPQRLAWLCETHNRADAGQRPHHAPKGTRTRAAPRRDPDWTAWALGAAVAAMAAWVLL